MVSPAARHQRPPPSPQAGVEGHAAPRRQQRQTALQNSLQSISQSALRIQQPQLQHVSPVLRRHHVGACCWTPTCEACGRGRRSWDWFADWAWRRSCSRSRSPGARRGDSCSNEHAGRRLRARQVSSERGTRSRDCRRGASCTTGCRAQAWQQHTRTRCTAALKQRPVMHKLPYSRCGNAIVRVSATPGPYPG